MRDEAATRADPWLKQKNETRAFFFSLWHIPQWESYRNVSFSLLFYSK